VSSLRDLDIAVTVPIRRLKPAVNSVSSLRDFMVNLTHSAPQNNISPFFFCNIFSSRKMLYFCDMDERVRLASN